MCVWYVDNIVIGKKKRMISGFEIDDHNSEPNIPSKAEPVSQHTQKESPPKNEDSLANPLFDQNPMYDKTMSTLRQFSDYKLQMAIKQVEIEKKLSKALDDKILKYLESLASTEKKLKEEQSILQEKLDKATQDLLASEKFSTIGELTSRFTHDVRNPLSLIEIQLGILQSKLLKDDDEHSRIAFLRIYRALSGINHMVEQVINYVREKPLHVKQTELSDILKSCVTELAIPETIKITLPEEKCTIQCDDYQMGIVFNNLISNAVESLEGNGEIKIKLIDNLDYVLVEIQDSGPGIPKDMMEQIFEPLVTTKKKGTGLGLTSCLKIVMHHHGMINVQNNPTKFSVKLPKNLEIL